MLLRLKGRFVAEATRFKPPIVRRFPRAIFSIARAMRFTKSLAGQAAPHCCRRSGRAWRRVLSSRAVPSSVRVISTTH
jgi:hypothetical protein